MEDRKSFGHLPQGWVWATLEDILSTLESGKRPKGGAKGITQGIPSIGGEHILHNGEFDLANIRYIPTGYFESMAHGKIARRDVLVVKDGATTGKTGFVSDAFPFKEAAVNEHVFILRVFEEFTEPKYLFYWMQSSFGQECVRENFQGTAQGGINTTFVKNSKFPLPPFQEQRRIVAKLEELLARLDAGVEGLRKVRAGLKRYRQSVLKCAFEGKLTEEWRKTHKDILEPASALLKRILRSRRVKWESNYLAQLKVRGVTPEGDRWKKRYKEPVGPEITNLPELPAGWIWVNLGQLAWSVRDGPHYSPEYADQGIPFITGGNVRPSGVDFDSSRRISPELHRKFVERCKPEIGDILYTKGGTTGIARVNTYAHEFSVWVHVAVLKLAEPVESFYVQHALNSPFCFEQAQRFTHGVGNQDLGLTRMIRILLTLPPLAEQKEIVAEIDRLQSIIDEVERVVQTNYEYAGKFRQVILRDAFSGKLVSQDPQDEPVDRLLERIEAEKTKCRNKKDTSEGRNKPKQREAWDYVK